MIRYLITNGSSARDQKAWLTHLSGWMERGVDFIQIRERDVSARELAVLTRSLLHQRDTLHSKTKILVNDRADVAFACGADGLHLREKSILPVFSIRHDWIFSASCHDPAKADIGGAHLLLLAPIFIPLSKDSSTRALGLEALKLAVTVTSIPILALGGITRTNEHDCIAAGAAGIAGISYFGDPHSHAG